MKRLLGVRVTVTGAVFAVTAGDEDRAGGLAHSLDLAAVGDKGVPVCPHAFLACFPCAF